VTPYSVAVHCITTQKT